jgi:hypothetical protein
MDPAGGAPPTPRTSRPSPSSHPCGLDGHLLERVCRAYREAAAAGDPRHVPFLVAAGALAVYARACRIPVEALLRELERVLAAEPLRPLESTVVRRQRGVPLRSQLWAQARHAAMTNYYEAD